MPITVYHNPRCTKSRQVLKLLQERGLDVNVVEYLRDPPDEATIHSLLRMLDFEPGQLIRRHERVYRELNLDDKRDDPAALVRAMAQNPILIERPIVVHGDRAKVGRPPEAVLDIL